MDPYSPDFADKVIDLFTEKRTVEAFRVAHRHAFKDASSKEPSAAQAGGSGLCSRDVELGDRIGHSCSSGELHEVMSKCILSRLPRPEPFCAADLEDEFCAVMRVRPEHFSVAYDLFVGNVDQRLLKANKTEPFAVAQATGKVFRVNEEGASAKEATQWGLEDSPIVVWESPGCCVQIVGKGMPDLHRDDLPLGHNDFDELVYAVVVGLMSDRRCREIRRELRLLVASLFRSVFDPTAVETFVHVTRDQVDTGLSEIRRCLDAFFSNSTKKDSLDRRIRNAAILIAEGDRQENVAVALSLYTAAGEALVVKGNVNVTRQFCENVATMLEREVQARDRAERKLEKLYDVRCQTLHGRKVEQEMKHRNELRLIVGSLFLAVLEYRWWLREFTADGADRDDVLFEAIKEAKVNQAPIDGVTISPARAVWAEPRPPFNGTSS